MNHARAAAMALACSTLSGVLTSAVAQHEHHGGAKLDTLVARAERDVIQLRSGATVVDARASPAAGSSIADLLRTVPGVVVNPDGSIGLRGNSSVLVLMNGRRMPLTGDALAAFLHQMPAAALERIEAGTVASARHDANGAGGVVNLVFREASARRTGGYSLAGSAAAGDHYMGSAAATGSLGNRLNWSATYSLSGTQPLTDSKTARWSLVPGDLPLQTDQASRARERHRLHSILAGATVMPTPHTSVALRGIYSWMEGSYRSRSAYVYTNAAGNTGTSTTRSVLEHEIPSGELGAMARIDRDRIQLAVEARTTFMDEDFRGEYDDEDAGYRYLSAVMDTRQRERLLRSDLRIQWSGITVAIGHESRFTTVTAGHLATHLGTTSSQAFRYGSDVHAAYIAADRCAGSLCAEAGVRIEVDRTRVEGESATERNATRLFPSLSGEWTNALGTRAYRIAYIRRIDRPDPDMLSPFTMGEDDLDGVIGDPSLRAPVSHQLELGMEWHGERVTAQLTPFIRWTRDPIRPLKAATLSGGTTTALANLATARTLGAEGSARAPLTSGATVTLAGSVAHCETRDANFRSSGVCATAQVTVDARLAANTSVQVHASRRGAQDIEQGEILPTFNSDLALTQRVAGGRGRVTLRVNDPFRTERLEFRVADATFTQESRRRRVRPLLTLFASYAVGGVPREDAPSPVQEPARLF